MTGRQALIAYPMICLLVLVVPPQFGGLTFEGWIHILTASLVLTALPGAIAFPLMYARVDWWTTRLGRAVMMMALSICGIVVLAVLRVLSDWPMVWETYSADPLPVDFTRLMVYLLMATAIYYKTAALWLLSRHGSDLHADDAEVRSHDHSEESSSTG